MRSEFHHVTFLMLMRKLLSVVCDIPDADEETTISRCWKLEESPHLVLDVQGTYIDGLQKKNFGNKSCRPHPQQLNGL